MVKIGVEAEVEAETGMVAELLRSVGDTLMNGFLMVIV